MELSKRQNAIIEIVKANEPISGDKIAEALGLTKPTLRSDLAVLTMTGVLDARPKVGYIYSGLSFEPLLHSQLFETKVGDLMTSSIIVFPETTVRDATTSLFMYDSGSLYVTDKDTGDLIGLVSRKDLLRSLLNSDNSDISIAIIMTRMPNIYVSHPEMTVLEAGKILTKHEIDSLPVVENETSKKVIGKISKTRIMEHFINMGSESDE